MSHSKVWHNVVWWWLWREGRCHHNHYFFVEEFQFYHESNPQSLQPLFIERLLMTVCKNKKYVPEENIVIKKKVVALDSGFYFSVGSMHPLAVNQGFSNNIFHWWQNFNDLRLLQFGLVNPPNICSNFKVWTTASMCGYLWRNAIYIPSF